MLIEGALNIIQEIVTSRKVVQIFKKSLTREEFLLLSIVSVSPIRLVNQLMAILTMLPTALLKMATLKTL